MGVLRQHVEDLLRGGFLSLKQISDKVGLPLAEIDHDDYDT